MLIGKTSATHYRKINSLPLKYHRAVIIPTNYRCVNCNDPENAKLSIIIQKLNVLQEPIATPTKYDTDMIGK